MQGFANKSVVALIELFGLTMSGVVASSDAALAKMVMSLLMTGSVIVGAPAGAREVW